MKYKLEVFEMVPGETTPQIKMNQHMSSYSDAARLAAFYLNKEGYYNIKIYIRNLESVFRQSWILIDEGPF